MSSSKAPTEPKTPPKNPPQLPTEIIDKSIGVALDDLYNDYDRRLFPYHDQVRNSLKASSKFVTQVITSVRLHQSFSTAEMADKTANPMKHFKERGNRGTLTKPFTHYRRVYPVPDADCGRCDADDDSWVVTKEKNMATSLEQARRVQRVVEARKAGY